MKMQKKTKLAKQSEIRKKEEIKNKAAKNRAKNNKTISTFRIWISDLIIRRVTHVLASALRSLGGKIVTQLMPDVSVLKVSIIYCTDKEMRNFQKKWTLHKTLLISQLKKAIGCLFERGKYYSFFQLNSLSQIWLGSFGKNWKRFEKRSKNQKLEFFYIQKLLSTKTWESPFMQGKFSRPILQIKLLISGLASSFRE